ncbi:DUF1778 domain-containing protein [Pantanalinema rosaneae CENA516]|uniref:type II toxin-antitoxin system TacA family antitoxin n=1 Tax=Pantanalinema rosaneae TaxID=1620701 RepID=UPI003D6F0224
MSSASRERHPPRDITINIRAQQRQRDLIDRAAEAIGKSRSDFMLEAACQKAEDVLLDRRVFSLSNQQWQAFLKALDAPPQSPQPLKKLLNEKAVWDS